MVAGVDGCPTGWIAVLWDGREDGAPAARLCPTFADVLALPEAPTVIAVDIPIGLASAYAAGGRRCDIEARSRLGARQSSVFPAPCRAAVAELDYRAACTANRARSDPPRGVSIHCFNIFPKIREVDALMTPALQERVLEVHPELSFWAMNASTPLAEPKKVRGTPYSPGLAARRGLLEQSGFPVEHLDMPTWPRRVVGPDDILDACAAAWSACRILQRRHVCLSAGPLRDERGLRMEINA